MPTIQSAKIFVENGEGKILLLHRTITAPTHPLEWDLPGGLIEQGEGIIAGANRELKEESGLMNLTLEDKLVITKTYGDATVHHHYLATVSSETKITLSYEHDKYQWCTKEEFPNNIERPQFIEAFNAIYN